MQIKRQLPLNSMLTQRIKRQICTYKFLLNYISLRPFPIHFALHIEVIKGQTATSILIIKKNISVVVARDYLNPW